FKPLRQLNHWSVCHGITWSTSSEYTPKTQKIEIIEPLTASPEAYKLITADPEQPKTEQPEDWSGIIKELESHFKTIELPNSPIQLNRGTKIISVQRFYDSHLTIIKANNGKELFTPYLNRLQELKAILK
ncbi:hypothetical protein I5M32_11380, partial [Pedobacter sp. SD-b]